MPGREPTGLPHIHGSNHRLGDRDALSLTGFAAASFAKLDPSVEGYQSLAGIECEAACTHDASSGVNRENWSILRGKTQVKPVQPAALRVNSTPSLASVLAGTCRSTGQPCTVGSIIGVTSARCRRS